jgi:hypothetical protein
MLVIPALLAPVITFQPREEEALFRYRTAVNAYVQLHREAVAALPPGGLCGGPEQLELLQRDLASEIRFARPNPREGDIFTPDIATIFRARLTRALEDLGMEAADVLAPDPDEPPVRRLTQEVNGFFPWEAGPPRWRELFGALPSLPEELEYRLVGGDLVLLDVNARLVVDVLTDAFRETGLGTIRSRWRSTAR